MSAKTKVVPNAISGTNVVDISHWLPQAWSGEIKDGGLALPEELNVSLPSRMVYVLGTAFGYFIICPTELMTQEYESGKFVPFPRNRNHEPPVYGIGMTVLTEDGWPELPKEILDAPEFEDHQIVFVERHGNIEVWSMAAWTLAGNA